MPDVYHPNGQIEYGAPGMTLRDWFAGQALAGEIASTSTEESAGAIARAAIATGRDPALHVAITCYELADAMLAARQRTATNCGQSADKPASPAETEPA